MEKRDRALDNVKWILTLLIVLFHIGYNGSGGTEKSIFMYMKNMGNCVVPAFALISGYLFWRNVNSLDSVKNKMQRRVLTLVVPYMAWNIINTIYVNVLNCIKINRFDKTIFDLNIYDDVIMWNSSPHLWYMFMLIFWMILSPILFYIFKSKILTILFLGIQMIFILYRGKSILYSELIYMIYIWGGVIGQKKPDLVNSIENLKQNQKLLISLISAFVFLALGIVTTLQEIPTMYLIWIVAFRSIALIFAIIFFPLLIVGSKSQYKYSFWVYAVHYWLDYTLASYIGRFTDGILYQFITWSSVIIISLSIGWLTNRFMPKLFKILTGNR